MPPSLSFLKSGSQPEAALRNLFQHYLRDMAEWFEVDANPDGSYAYDISAIWEKGFETYLAKVDDSVAGFALVRSADEWLGEVDAHDLHPFFVLRGFRRCRVWRHLPTHKWNRHTQA